MGNSVFEIGADGVDAGKIVADIQAAVDKKMADGAYTDARVARAERLNLARLKSDDSFLSFYFKCLRDAVFVDISDFDIAERRKGWIAPLLVRFKRVVWVLLKFYTYRLWSQQNQINGLLVTAVEGLDEKTDAHIRKLEERVAALEKQLPR